MDIKRPLSKQPIPINAKRVFKGEIFDVYQWRQKLFDGSFATFEKIKRADSVNVIPITKEGKIILTQQEQPGAKPFIGVLGGRMDKGEKSLDTARRELLEESGYKAKKFILWDVVQPYSKIDWAVYTFIAKDCERVKEPEMDPGERIKLLYLSFDEFLKVLTREDYRDSEIVLKVLQETSLKVFQSQKDPRKLQTLRRLFEN